MTTSDGSVVGVTKIVDNGPDNARWNLVIMGDGYQTGQLTQYHNDVQSFVTTLFATPPFDDLRTAINVYRVDVTSTDAARTTDRMRWYRGHRPDLLRRRLLQRRASGACSRSNDTTALTVAATRCPSSTWPWWW